jgi:hypothetical protein
VNKKSNAKGVFMGLILPWAWRCKDSPNQPMFSR